MVRDFYRFLLYRFLLIRYPFDVSLFLVSPSSSNFALKPVFNNPVPLTPLKLSLLIFQYHLPNLTIFSFAPVLFHLKTRRPRRLATISMFQFSREKRTGYTVLNLVLRPSTLSLLLSSIPCTIFTVASNFSAHFPSRFAFFLSNSVSVYDSHARVSISIPGPVGSHYARYVPIWPISTPSLISISICLSLCLSTLSLLLSLDNLSLSLAK